MAASPVTPTLADVRTLASLAGLKLPEEELATIAEQLGGILTQLASVADEALEDLEPAFVLPLERSGP